VKDLVAGEKITGELTLEQYEVRILEKKARNK